MDLIEEYIPKTKLRGVKSRSVSFEKKVRTILCKNCFMNFLKDIKEEEYFCSKDCRTTYKMTWREMDGL